MWEGWAISSRLRCMGVLTARYGVTAAEAAIGKEFEALLFRTTHSLSVYAVGHAM